MPNYDEKTSRGWPLPHPDNDLEHDVERLRTTFRAIDKALGVIEEHVSPLEEQQNFLETRLDVIAGQTTEDTEILDARVDAEATVHPNLGHNLRALHSYILALIEELDQDKANLENEISERESNDEAYSAEFHNIKLNVAEGWQALHSLAELRLHEDNVIHNNFDAQGNFLQAQISENASLILKNVLDLLDEIEARKSVNEELNKFALSTLQSLDANFKAILQEAKTRQAENERLDETISQAVSAIRQELSAENQSLRAEIQTREDEIIDVHNEIKAGVQFLQEQVDDNAADILRNTLELEERKVKDNELTERLDAEISERSAETQKLQNTLTDEIQHGQTEETTRKQEISAVHEEVAALGSFTQEQNDTLANEVLSLNYATHELKRNLTQETQARQNEDSSINKAIEALQTKDDDLADVLNAEIAERSEEIQILLETIAAENLTRELEIKAAREEIQALGNFAQEQIDDNSADILRNTLEIAQEQESRSQLDKEIHEALLHEEESRLDKEASLVSDIQETSRSLREKEAVNVKHLQGQLDELSGVVSQEMLDWRESFKQEHEARVKSDENFYERSHLDQDAEASLALALDLAQEAEARRKLENVVAAIKSPVDWSKSDTLAISEPRCAIVNFTGLNSMPTSKTVEIPAIMEFWDMQGNYFKKNITCSAQGNSSLGYIKKNVKFDFLDLDLKIGNWVVQDGFHLKAYYTDFFRGVAVASYKFWDEVMRYNGLNADRPYKKALINTNSIRTSGTNLNNPDDLTLQLDTGALCHPDGFPCIVYLNGEFYGIYSWQIKKQRKNYHLDKSTVEHIHLDGSLYTQYFWNGVINWTTFEIRNPNKLYTMDGKKYDGDAPKELIDETSEKYNASNKDHVRSAKVKKYIQSLVQRFNELRASPSREKFEAIFDWENQRDYLIFSDIVRNSDGFGKNWQWTTYDGVKWFVNAYDLDMSFGGMFNGSSITAPLTGHITTSTAIPTGYVINFYRSELEARYRELRDTGIISVNNILSKLEDWTARIGTGNFELEYERWPNSPCILNYTDSILRVKKWLEIEIANMDNLYHYEPPKAREHAEIFAEVESLNALHDQKLREEISNQALARSADDKGLQEQIDEISGLILQKTFDDLSQHEQAEAQSLRETQIRFEQDEKFQTQINDLAYASLQSINNIGNIITSFKNINEMLDEIFPRS